MHEIKNVANWRDDRDENIISLVLTVRSPGSHGSIASMAQYRTDDLFTKNRSQI